MPRPHLNLGCHEIGAEKTMTARSVTGFYSERPRSLLLPLGVPSRPSPGSYPGPVQVPSRGVPSRFAMCFVLQYFGPIQVPRWGPSRPVLVPSWSRAFLPGSGLDGPKQTSWPLPIYFFSLPVNRAIFSTFWGDWLTQIRKRQFVHKMFVHNFRAT